MKYPQVELLAPASGMEAIRAAIQAGADAIYTGGTRFGARAYADNLAREELLEAIDYVHLHGKQIYLTVNTLLKEKELEEELEEYLRPYYEHGLDAVIVQDAGVFKMVHSYFPDMPVHVSTQAVVTGKNSARQWENMGASRIVTARELSLEEIREIRKETTIEIESFVHGALCYCYSGQCLFSSFLGGRSGNRGKCAQPCRLPYELTDSEGRPMSKEPYLLSPKDMCTLDILPDIIEAGVYSLKIEGRMKRPEYTAGVTEIYRKYIDAYLHGEKEAYAVSPKDRERLMDLYNRGNFHSGYYTMHNGKEMMSMERPNHNGVFAGTMVSGKKGYRMKAETDLFRQDVLEFRKVADRQKAGQPLELTLERNVARGEEYSLPEKYTFLLGKRPSVEVYRTRNEELLQSLHKKYIEETKPIEITGYLKVEEGKPLLLTVRYDQHCITVTGDVAESAKSRPAEMEDIRKQVAKTGNTPFVFETLDVELKGSCFVSVKALKQLRRDALEQLEKAVVSSSRRGKITVSHRREISETAGITEGTGITKKKKIPNTPESVRCHVSVETMEQLECVLSFDMVKAVYISIHAFSLSDDKAIVQKLNETVRRCHAAGKQMYLVLPHIWRKDTEEKLAPLMDALLKEIDGIVAKNMEVLTFVNSYEFRGEVVLDYTAYAMNRRSVSVWKELGADRITAPVELNRKELQALLKEDVYAGKEAGDAIGQAGEWELIVYGHLPMMVSAQCPVKNTTGCKKTPVLTRLKDRKGSRHYVKNYCDDCYAVIYNSEPLVLMDLQAELQDIPADVHRLCFTVESAGDTKKILDSYVHGMKPEITYTRGHWKRGV